MDASHVYVGTWALGCFHSHISAQTFPEGADRVGGHQPRGDIECPFSGVTKSGRVWRKVPESDARSVYIMLSMNAGFAGREAESEGGTGRVGGDGRVVAGVWGREEVVAS